jgi:serine protease AprX
MTTAIHKTTLRNAALLVAFLLASLFAFAGEKKLSPELDARTGQPGNAHQLVDVIIQFRPGTQLPKKIAHMLDLGAKHRTSLDVIHGGLFRIPAGLLPLLASDSDILYVSPDRPVKRTSPEDYLLDATQANYIFQYGYYGNGIGIAVIDSGIRANHPDLQNTSTGASRVVYSQSFISGLDANDAYGHGTHVAGLLAGNGQSSGGWMRGIAQKASLINLRVLDANGAGTDSQVIAAIQQAINLKSTYNIRVINLSLGRPVSESYTLDPLCQAVEQAWKAGIVVVVAAGNDGRNNSMNTDGYATITVPGNDPYVITVGAISTHATDTTADDTVASYSSKGPTLLDHVVKPDLVAPGNHIVSLIANGSTLDTTYPANEVPPSEYGSYSNTPLYFRLSGTSMAAPLVSGTVALMLQRIPSLTPDQVKIRLMKTAAKNYPAYTGATASNGAYYSLQDDIFAVGAGYLNTYAAVLSNDLPVGNSLSPTVTRDLLGNVLLTPNSQSAWGTSITWGSSIVWGGNVLQANSIIWGSSIVWGNQMDTGNSIIWGSSIVWGVNSTPFSESGDSDNN